MFKIILLIFICVNAHAYNPTGCYSEAQSKLKILKSKNLNLRRSVEEAISDNLYYFCDLNLSGAESWVCVDRLSVLNSKKSDVIHISPEFEFWFEGKDDEAQRVEIATYTDNSYISSGRYNHFNLVNGFVLTLEKKSKNYRVNGMALDNREGDSRSFKNIECFDVKKLVENN